MHLLVVRFSDKAGAGRCVLKCTCSADALPCQTEIFRGWTKTLWKKEWWQSTLWLPPQTMGEYMEEGPVDLGGKAQSLLFVLQGADSCFFSLDVLC
ncbi:hypothetical protein XENOCAPTIV_025232 [Xenoophorus captivus]|uniref:Uncharacterized protein n=1 Tax=Xenoophorus captivus TaxID=1517983 RepID=A0ABV0SIT6_9TELE